MRDFEGELYKIIVEADENFSDSDAMAKHIVHMTKKLIEEVWGRK